MATFDSFIKQWSTTPASNGTTPNIVPYGWPEGMAPSAVNNTARQQMADHRYQWQDAQWFCWGDTVSKASTNSIKIASDVTSRYIANRRVKILDNTTLYATIRSSSYSAPDTTITLDIDNNSTLATTTPQIALSILTPDNPSIPKSFVQNKNVIIGGNFDTNPWQRGTTFTSFTNGQYGPDRFCTNYVGAMVLDMKRTLDAPTVAQCGMFIQYCLHLDVTTADSSIAAGDLTVINHRIEGYNWSQIAQRTCTLSFWVKATKTGTYCVSLSNIVDQSYVAEYTVNASDTWEFKTVTFSASPNSGTWNYTNGEGIRVRWTLAGGSTWQTTAGSWQAGNYFSTANQVNGVDSSSNDFKLALPQLEVGSIATSFEIESAPITLAKCQRYFWKTFAQGTAPAQNIGSLVGSLNFPVISGGTTNPSDVMVIFPTLMRTTPTIVFYSPKSASTNWYNNTVGANSGASSTVGNLSDFGFGARDTKVVGDTTGSTCFVNCTADAEL